MRRIILSLLLLGQITVIAQNNEEINTITTSVPFLLISPDSRAGGLGNSGVATSPDENSQHWNPAKYARLKDTPYGLSVSYIPWLQQLNIDDMSITYLSSFYRLAKGRYLSGSLKYFSLGSINFTDNVGNSTGTGNPREMAFDLGFSTTLGENFSGAITMRYINSNLLNGAAQTTVATIPGRAMAADIAGFYSKELELNEKDARINAGFNISNVGNKITYSETQERDFIPINMRLGAGLEIDIDDYNKVGFYGEVNKLLVPTPPIYSDSADANGNLIILQGMDPNVPVPVGIFQSFADAPGGVSEELQEVAISGGVEYWYDEKIAVRGGYFYENPLKGNRQFFTLGAGLRYEIFKLDFSYLITPSQNHPLQNTLRFTLSFDFSAINTEGDAE